MREITIKPPVTLASLSTDMPERAYRFVDFVSEFVLASKGMRETPEALEAMFRIEQAFEGKNEGDRVKLEDADWLKGRDAAKAAIDDLMGRNPPFPTLWATKILRHYHTWASAPEVSQP